MEKGASPRSSPSRRVFDFQRCVIPTFWCGTGPVPQIPKDGQVYTRAGTPYECLKKGFGAGTAIERRKHVLLDNSLLTIRYIGPAHEKKFMDHEIFSTDDLVERAASMEPRKLKQWLKSVLIRKGGFDGRALNSVLLFLYNKGQRDLPKCTRL